MRRVLRVLVCLALWGCVTPEVAPADVVQDLAPTGTLRAAVADDRVSAALARELGKRLRVPVRLVSRRDPWDVAFVRQARLGGGETEFAGETHPGHPRGERYLRDFLDEMKASGFMDAAFEKARRR